MRSQNLKRSLALALLGLSLNGHATPNTDAVETPQMCRTSLIGTYELVESGSSSPECRQKSMQLRVLHEGTQWGEKYLRMDHYVEGWGIIEPANLVTLPPKKLPSSITDLPEHRMSSLSQNRIERCQASETLVRQKISKSRPESIEIGVHTKLVTLTQDVAGDEHLLITEFTNTNVENPATIRKIDCLYKKLRSEIYTSYDPRGQAERQKVDFPNLD